MKAIIAKNLTLLIGNKSLNAVAQAIGIPQQTLYRYVNKQALPQITMLVKIADYFNVSVDSLCKSH